MFRKFGHYQGINNVPDNDWPIICLLANQRRQIDELKMRLDGHLSPPAFVTAPTLTAAEPATVVDVPKERAKIVPRGKQLEPVGA